MHVLNNAIIQVIHAELHVLHFSWRKSLFNFDFRRTSSTAMLISRKWPVSCSSVVCTHVVLLPFSVYGRCSVLRFAAQGRGWRRRMMATVTRTGTVSRSCLLQRKELQISAWGCSLMLVRPRWTGNRCLALTQSMGLQELPLPIVHHFVLNYAGQAQLQGNPWMLICFRILFCHCMIWSIRL